MGGRKVGTILTALKDKAGLYERKAARLEALLEDKQRECAALRVKIRQLEALLDDSQPNK